MQWSKEFERMDEGTDHVVSLDMERNKGTRGESMNQGSQSPEVG